MDGEPETQRGEDEHRETGQNGSAHRAEAVHLADHVAQDVGEREQEECAVGDQTLHVDGTDVDVEPVVEQHDTLGAGDVTDQHHADEERDEQREIAATDGGERGAGCVSVARLDLPRAHDSGCR